MRATIDTHALREALRRLQPSRKYKSMRESLVTATAGGSALVITGSLDSSASVAAEVHQAGIAQIPLDMAIKLLGSYKNGSRILVCSEPGAVFFDKVRFTI